jgi:hypothetical protein
VAAVSEVTICNQAIGWLGGNLIISLNDPSTEAKLCKANYEILRDSVLEGADWSFAMTRRVLTPEAVVPAWGYSSQFTIPGSVLRIIYCGNSARLEEDDPVADWQREGQTIVANAGTIYMRGILRVTDPAMFSSLFAQALAARIAMDLAIPITNSRSMMSDMATMYGRKMGEAVSQDSKQGRTRVLRAPGMIAARRAGATNSYIGPEV